jgi:hypothetical protein
VSLSVQKTKHAMLVVRMRRVRTYRRLGASDGLQPRAFKFLCAARDFLHLCHFAVTSSVLFCFVTTFIRHPSVQLTVFFLFYLHSARMRTGVAVSSLPCLPTPWSRVLPEKLRDPQLDSRNFSHFMETER